jgi:hypothetical protein
MHYSFQEVQLLTTTSINCPKPVNFIKLNRLARASSIVKTYEGKTAAAQAMKT